MGQRELDLVTEYTVHPYDAVLGMYYARARMLDTGDRRFMAVDPVKGSIGLPQILMQYIYCLNNPLFMLLRHIQKICEERRQIGLLQAF